MRRRTLCAGLATGSLFGWLTACGPTEIADRRRELLRNWGERFLLASYAEMHALALELELRAGELRAAPSEETLVAAQNAWWSVRSPWKRTETFAFGPYDEEPLRFGPRIDFWPARPDTIEAVLESDEPLDAEGLALLGVSAKGLTALEYLLFQPEVELVSEFELVPRRGEYVQALASELVELVAQLAFAWDPAGGNFLKELVDPGRSGTRFPTLNRALGEIVNRIGFTLENARLEKLGPALGDKADGTPQPSALESPFSGRSRTDLEDNLRGIELLVLGDPALGLLGLDGYLQSRDRFLARPFSERLAACRAALAEVPEPLSVAVFEAQASLRQVMARLADLQRFVQVDVINALSLTVTFNDNDGD